MKHLKKIFRTLTALILLLSCNISFAQESEHPMDSVEIGLITCSPHEEVYSLYGHSALRVHNLKTSEDVVYNWGIFNFSKRFFVLRFIFGLTDYELDTMPFEAFCNYYQHWGSSVTEQVLDLTTEEKENIQQALANNLRPENKIYRYNFFYDNCSTRPRNIIENSLIRKLHYTGLQDDIYTYRQLVRFCTRNHPWATFGNDILLGVKADRKLISREEEFLPEKLMNHMLGAQTYGYGSYHPLVKEMRMIVPPGVQFIESDFPASPLTCSLLLLALSVLIFCWEWKRKKTFKVWDLTLMTLQGLAGLVLTAMLFSLHPTVSLNFQLLLLNPIPLFYIFSVAKGRKTYYWHVLFTMIVLFYIGGIWQNYADGMNVLALSLLLRICIHLRLNKK